MDQVLLYVATDGDDRWSGTLPSPAPLGQDGPFATLSRARDAVRQLRRGASAPVTVRVRGGTYFLDQPLVLGKEDSGAPDSPVTYAAHVGESPVLSGGRKVTGWTPYRGEISRAELPDARGGRWRFRQLFYGGKRQPRAHWPKQDPQDALAGWAFVEAPAAQGSTQAFVYRPGAFRHRWAKPTQVEVNLFVGHNWINDIVPIAGIDEARRVIALARPIYQIDRSPWFVPVPLHPQNRFRVENALEDLDRPGEWCLDSEEGALYFWPPDGSLTGEVVVPALDCLVQLRGASWVTLSGFTLTQTLDGDDYHHEGYEGYGPVFPRRGVRYGSDAILLREAESCRIEDNLFDAVGGTAVYLEGRNTRNLIRRNEISHAGAYGVAMVGARDYHPAYNRVEDNLIHHCGAINKYANGVFLGLSNMNTVAHNHLHHLPHVAVGLGNSGYGRNIVEYNEIRFVDLEISDSGAINAWMEDPYPAIRAGEERAGHIIRHNLIADVPGVQVEADGRLRTPAHTRRDLTMGIYLDTCTSNCLVYGNLLVRAGRFGVYIQGGRNNLVENNVVVDCACAAAFSDLVAHWFAPWMKGFMVGNRFCRNVLCTSCPDGYLHQLIHWSDGLVEQCDENTFFLEGGAAAVVLGDDGAELSLAQWQAMGFDRGSVVADPLFVDAAGGDYRLAPESPARRTGFEPLHLDRVGIRARPRE